MNHPSDSKVMSQIEEQLKEASSNVLSEINTHIANAPAPTPGKKNIKVFIVPGAQCMGKSWICSQLDSRKSKICSFTVVLHFHKRFFNSKLPHCSIKLKW